MNRANPTSRARRRAATRRPRPVVEALEGRTLLTVDFNLTRGVTAIGIETSDVATDAAGNRYVSGSFFGTVDFDPGVAHPGNTDILTSTNNSTTGFPTRDLFVAKYSAAGALAWVRGAGGQLDDRAAGVAVDDAGNVYSTGFYTQAVNFGGVVLPSATGTDIFVWKLDPAGATVWARGTTAQVNRSNQTQGIAVNGAGTEVVVAGFIQGTIDFGATTLATASDQTVDGFVARLDGAGNYVWARQLAMAAGGIGFGERVALDPAGNVIATGGFSGTIDLDPGAGTTTRASAGSFDALVVKLDPAGNFAFGKAFGGAGVDQGNDVAADSAGNIYVIGRHVGTIDLDPGVASPGDTLVVPNDQAGLFVMRLGPGGNFVWGLDPGARINDITTDDSQIGRPSIAISPGDQIAIAGAYQSPFNIAGQTFTSAGGSDVFVARINTAGAIIDANRGGGAGQDTARGVAINNAGNIALTGQYTGPATFGATTLPAIGGQPSGAFIAGLSVGTAPARARFGDYDGDGRADIAVYRPSTGLWLISQSTAGPRSFAFGAPNLDIPVPGDYDGDGKFDLAVYRPTTGQWFILQSTAGPRVVGFGGANLDLPVPGDYDGDGKFDLAVYRPTTAQWLISQTTAGPRLQAFGAPGLDTPVLGDFDGDGRSDLAVYRTSTAQWLISQSSAGPRVTTFGGVNIDTPIPADFDGDGRTDLAVFRISTAQWLISQSTAGPRLVAFGGVGIDVPVPADYDGDGQADLAIYRPSAGLWLINQTAAGPRQVTFGGPNLDFPLTAPLAFRYNGGLRTSSLRASGLGAGGAGPSARGFAAQAPAPAGPGVDLIMPPEDAPPTAPAGGVAKLATATPPAVQQLPQRGDTYDPVLALALDELNVFGAGLKRPY